ncbi:MAG TPA: glycine/betaine ABC transporter substrate-binding protein, partial [Thermoanaerobacterales bacterium]|nr:glycine/betaine ABC transporter substrate-binding protein [Thermoanaerobacterales bacterium]
MKWSNLVIIAVISALILTGILGCSKKEKEIRIGGKEFSEQYIMADMLSILIEENTDLKTVTMTNLGGNVIFNGMKVGDIDLYVEYTGTGLMYYLGMEPMNDPDEVYEIVKKEFDEQFNIKWMKPYGFNNTYAMVVAKDTAEKYNLKTISDMEKIADELILGCNYSFLERGDGYPGLKEHYGFEFGDVKGMEASLMYQAVDQGSVDVISAYATDGRIPTLDLVILEDDKHFFPPYDATAIVRGEILEEHPELEEILNSLANLIDDIKMAELNAAVDLDK